MRRPRRKLEVSTFPFLAVLLCAMGSLILILMVMDRRAKMVAQNKARDEYFARMQAIETDTAARDAARKELESKQHADWLARKEQIHAELKAEHDALANDITRMLAALAMDDDRRAQTQSTTAALEQKIAVENASLLAMQKEVLARRSQLEQAKQSAQGQLALREQLTRDVLLLEAALKAARDRKAQQRPVYSLVPYKGKHGATSKPVYIEVSETGLAIHPGPTRLSALSLSATAFHQAIEQRTGPLEKEVFTPGVPPPDSTNNPYLLFLVRPDGISLYYETLQTLRNYRVDFGYELVEADWTFDFSDGGLDQQPWRNTAKLEFEPANVTRPAPKGLGPRPLPILGSNIPPIPGESGTPGTPGSPGEGMSDRPGPFPGSRGPFPQPRPGGFANGPGGVPASGPSGISPSGPPGGVPGGMVGGTLVNPPGSIGGGGFAAIPPPPGSIDAANPGIRNGTASNGDRKTGQPSDTTGVPGTIDLGAIPSPRSPAPAVNGTGRLADGPARNWSPGSPFAPPGGVPGRAPAVGNPGDGSSVVNSNPDGPPPAMTSRSPSPSPSSSDPLRATPSDPKTAPSDSTLTFRTVPPPGSPPSSASGARGPANGDPPPPGENRPRSPDDSSDDDPGPRVGHSPFLPKEKRVPGPRLPALGRITGNRDFVLVVECFENSASLSPPGRTFDLSQTDAIELLARQIKTLVDRRQGTVRPGEPAFRPIVAFRVHPDGRRTYYNVYPRIAEFGYEMTREAAE